MNSFIKTPGSSHGFLCFQPFMHLLVCLLKRKHSISQNALEINHGMLTHMNISNFLLQYYNRCYLDEIVEILSDFRQFFAFIQFILFFMRLVISVRGEFIFYLLQHQTTWATLKKSCGYRETPPLFRAISLNMTVRAFYVFSRSCIYQFVC